MNGKVSLRDYEALSAYLDGSLEEQNLTRLEKRLQVEENLKQELEVLRRTRVILRSQPRLRAPRNFTLTPQMAGGRQQARNTMGAFSALRLASVLATIFLVLVMAGDLIGSSMKPQIIAASDLPQEAPLGMPAFGMGGGGGGGSDVSSEAEIAESQIAAEEEAMEIPAVQSTDAAAMKAMPEAGALQAEPALQVAPPSVAAEELGTSEERLPAEESEGEINDASTEALEEADLQQTRWPILRVLQVLLAILAVGTGVGALILRRTSRI
ncbi:MAG TPA: hypothetical protein VLM80_11770 [Anaerolineales bacterium]|nr:hypothetical protein [Anaerolineales bacterium]